MNGVAPSVSRVRKASKRFSTSVNCAEPAHCKTPVTEGASVVKITCSSMVGYCAHSVWVRSLKPDTSLVVGIVNVVMIRVGTEPTASAKPERRFLNWLILSVAYNQGLRKVSFNTKNDNFLFAVDRSNMRLIFAPECNVSPTRHSHP